MEGIHIHKIIDKVNKSKLKIKHWRYLKRQFSCLRDPVSQDPEATYFSDLKPGQLFSAEDQCEKRFGSRSKPCGTVNKLFKLNFF